MDENVQKKWERFLTPEVLRSNLILASIYIAAFEILKYSMIERIRAFYVSGFDENGFMVDLKYQNDVLIKDKSVTYASLQWLKESNAISDDDISTFNQVKDYRNLLAHEITKMLMEGLPPDPPKRFNDMVSLLDKIERWWIVNFEIPLNPNLAGKDIDENGIIPGPIDSLRMVLDVALVSDDDTNHYINELKKPMDWD